MTYYPDIITKSPENKFVERELTSEGPHAARIVGIIDMGLKINPKFGKIAHKLNFDIAVVDELVENKDSTFYGKMKHNYKKFSNSDSEMGDLYKEVLSKLGIKPDDKGHYNVVKSLLNTPLQITIVHKTETDKKGKPKTYDNIAGFSQLMKGAKIPESDVEPYVYSLTNHSEEALAKVPLWLQKQIDFASFGVDYTVPTEDGKASGDFGKG